MGWLSRNKRPSRTSTGAAVPDDGVPTEAAPADAVPDDSLVPGLDAASGDEPASAPMGSYGPLVAITAFDEGAEELSWQLPVNGELYRLVPGPDRPDYSIMLLERALHFYPAAGFDLDRVPPEQRVTDRKGRPMVRVHALVVCARFVGQQLHAGMQDLVVNIAHVIDPSLLSDPTIDLSKLEYAAIGRMAEGHTVPPLEWAGNQRRRDEPAAASEGQAGAPEGLAGAPEGLAGAPEGLAGAPEGPPATGALSAAAESVFRQVANVLRQGVADHRGRPVEWLDATLTLDEQHRLAGLSGIADGEPPVPTPDTFEQINEVLTALQDQDPGRATRRLTLRVSADTIDVEVPPTDS